MGLLESIAEKIKASIPPPFDPARFADPLAQQVAWTPLRGGGTNFRTHKLVPDGTMRMEFRATVGARLFSGVFLVGGLGALALTAAIVKEAARSDDWAVLLVPALIGIVFTAVGFFTLRSVTRQLLFDKSTGYFLKGRKVSDPQVRLSEIRAIQLIAEWIHGNKTSYHSYELNLVLADGERMNVVDHGNLRRVREDAQALAQFLDVPLWDATSP